MPKFYDQANDEDGEYLLHHLKANGLEAPLNLGHGATCDYCNDSVLQNIKGTMGKLTSFKLGRLEHKVRKNR